MACSLCGQLSDLAHQATGSAPSGEGLRTKASRVPLRDTATRTHESGLHRAVPTGELREQSAEERCVPCRSQASLPAVFSSNSWCRRRSAISGLLKRQSGSDDWTFRMELRPHLASQQQEKSERRFSVAVGLPGVRTVRPNPSLKVSPNGVAHWACGAGASPQFCAAVPARHTAGPTLARTLGLTEKGRDATQQ
jgi:hypothetical protein